MMGARLSLVGVFLLPRRGCEGEPAELRRGGRYLGDRQVYDTRIENEAVQL